LLQRLMLLVVIATSLRPAAKEGAVMGVEDDKDAELRDKRDEEDHSDEVAESRRKLDADVDKIKPGMSRCLCLIL